MLDTSGSRSLRDTFARPARRGAAAVAMVVLMLLLGIIVLGMVLGGARHQDLATHHMSATRSFYAAEAGISMAMREVLEDEDFDGNGMGNIQTTPAMANLFGGTAINVQATTAGNAVTFAGRGVHDQARHFVNASLNTASSGGGGSLLYGAGVTTNITMTGNPRIDALNSNSDTYNQYSNANGMATVGTNSTSNGHIHMTGSATIHGDVFVGPEGNPSSVISTRGRPTPGYTQAAMEDSFALPTVTPPSSLPPSQGNSSFASWGNGSLTSGTYHYDNFNLSGSYTLNIEGDVVIYASGDFNLGGGGAINIVEGGSLTVYADNYSFTGNASFNMQNGTAPDPKTATLYQTGSSDFTIVGSARVVGAIIAPNAHVSLTGNARSFGAIAAESLGLAGSARFTQDLAMTGEGSSVGVGGGGGGSGVSSIVSWSQVPPTD